MEILGQEEEERVLCLFRALRYYLNRTEKIRGPSSNHWCTVRNPSHPLSKNALSFSLRNLIREAHSQIKEDILPNFKVRVHDIRVVSTSLAIKRNMSLTSIFPSTYWRCRSIFASHYLKDVETVFNDSSTFGPLLVAGVVLTKES